MSSVINKKISKERTFDIKSPQGYIETKYFDQMISDQGVRVKVYKTTICPNVKSIGGPHNADCTVCYNEGFVDIDPTEVVAYIASQMLNKMMLVEGYTDNQTVNATFQSGTELQYGTRVDLVDFTGVYYELVQKQEGNVDRLKYAAHTVNYIIDQNNVRYYVGHNFDVNENGDLEWIKDPPAIGVIYSIHYNTTISYRALKAMHVNRYGNESFKKEFKEPVKLPELWVLKRRYLLTRADIDGLPLNPNEIINE